MMRTIADFVVYSPDDQVQLIVEVKNSKGTTDEWAAVMRRNLLAHAMIPPSRFFLLALPEYFYLWTPDQSVEPIPANYKVVSGEILKRFLDDAKLEDLSEQSLEILVNSWLSEVIGSRLAKESSPELSWIFDSGLYESIKDGSIRAETAA
jgi:hypothetical protein